MGLFSNIMSAIFGHGPAAAAPANPAPEATPSAAAPPQGSTSAVNEPAPAAGSPAAKVDVAVVLDGLAAKNSEPLDWKKSIVDLMKLVGMDSSLSSRKELAKELNYPGDESDSASMNVWLHKEVLKKLSENGGKVPAELLD